MNTKMQKETGRIAAVLMAVVLTLGQTGCGAAGQSTAGQSTAGQSTAGPAEERADAVGTAGPAEERADAVGTAGPAEERADAVGMAGPAEERADAVSMAGPAEERADAVGALGPKDTATITGRTNEIPRAQDDFYGYINKEKLDSMEMNYRTDQYSANMDDGLVDAQIAEMLQKICMEGSAEQYAPGSNEQLVSTCYLQGLDFLRSGRSGAKEAFLQEVDAVRNIGSVEEAKQEIARLSREGILVLLGIETGEDYLDGSRYGLYIRQLGSVGSYGLKDLYENDMDRQHLKNDAWNVLTAAGYERNLAEKMAKDYVYSALDIAMNTDFEVTMPERYFISALPTTDRELDEILTNCKAAQLRRLYGLKVNDAWLLQDPAQLKTVNSLFAEENLDVLRTWILVEYVYHYRILLYRDYDFIPSEFDGIGKDDETLAGLIVSNMMPDQTSELYAKYYYTEEMDQILNRMYDDIIAGYDELIRGADWLREGTKQDLLKKLYNMKFVNASFRRHETDPGDAKLIGADLFETYRNLETRRMSDNLKRQGKKINKEEPAMAMQTVNACYSPINTFTITVAIMQEPYFSASYDYGTNMGGLGMVMAHEIGHGFDSNCIWFDEDGRYRPERISEEETDAMKKLQAKTVEYYNGYVELGIYHVNGEKTLGENFADKGAMECLMKIVTKEQDRKKLFENYGLIWGQMRSDDYSISMLEKDEHSPNKVRVNAILSSTEEFLELYDVKEGDGMYVRPEERFTRWGNQK